MFSARVTRDPPPTARGVYPAGTWDVSCGTWGVSPGDVECDPSEAFDVEKYRDNSCEMKKMSFIQTTKYN
jgi:hypothetical protein